MMPERGDKDKEKPVASDRKLILASRVEHSSVFNEDGWLIGHVKDLSIDRESGQVIYAILSFGGLLGIGTRLHPLPWSVLRYDAEKHGYVVPLDTAALKDAPHYEAAELEEFGGPHLSEAKHGIFEYYGRYGVPPI